MSLVRRLVAARRPGSFGLRRVRCPGSSWWLRSRLARRRPPSRGAGLSVSRRRVVVALSVALARRGLCPCRSGLCRCRSAGWRSNVRVCGVLRFAFVVACVRAACAARRGVCRGLWPSGRGWVRGWPRRGGAFGLPVGGRVLGGLVWRWPARVCASLRRACLVLLRACGVSVVAVSVRPRAVCLFVRLFLRSRFGFVGVGGVCGWSRLACRGVSVRLLRAAVLGRVVGCGFGLLGFWLSPGCARAKCAFLRRTFSRNALEKSSFRGKKTMIFLDKLNIIYNIIFNKSKVIVVDLLRIGRYGYGIRTFGY